MGQEPVPIAVRSLRPMRSAEWKRRSDGCCGLKAMMPSCSGREGPISPGSRCAGNLECRALLLGAGG